jgi:hypothetical protein
MAVAAEKAAARSETFERQLDLVREMLLSG